MADLRKKASMSQVMDDIKPYITKHFMAQSTVHGRDIAAISQILLPRYKNVKRLQGHDRKCEFCGYGGSCRDCNDD